MTIKVTQSDKNPLFGRPFSQLMEGAFFVWEVNSVKVLCIKTGRDSYIKVERQERWGGNGAIGSGNVEADRAVEPVNVDIKWSYK